MLEKNIVYILFISFILYMSQDMLPSSFDLLTSVLGVLLIVICIYYLILIVRRKSYFNMVVTMLLIITFMYIISFFRSVRPQSALGLIQSFAVANFMFFPFFYLSKKNIINERHLRVIFIIILPCMICQYWYNSQDLSVKFDRLNNVNNAGYNLLCLIPMLLFFNNRIFKYICLALLSYLIVFSYKRGAIVTLIISFIPIFILFKNEIKKYKSNYLKYVISFIFVIIAFMIFMYKNIESNDYLQERFNSFLEGDVSGRDYLISKLLDYYFFNDDIFHYLFGEGMAFTVEVAGNYAHNDWLEELINNGLVGAFSLLIFYYSLYRIYSKERKHPYKEILLLSFIILFLRTIFSMSLGDHYSALVIVCIAFISGKYKNNQIYNTKDSCYKNNICS